MSLEGQGFSKKQNPIPTADQHVAMCYAIIDLGKQKEQFENKPAQYVNKVQFCWELPNAGMVTFDEAKGPQPMALFQEYTVAVGDKAKLPKMLCSWGRMPKIEKISSEFLKAFLGQACMIQVEHSASKKDNDADTGRPIIWANVGQKGLSVMPFASNLGLTKPVSTINPKIFFNLDQFSWEQYNALPKGVQKKIAESQEWSSILVKYPNNTVAAQAAPVQQAATFHGQGQVNQSASSFAAQSMNKIDNHEHGISTPAAGAPSF